MSVIQMNHPQWNRRKRPLSDLTINSAGRLASFRQELEMQEEEMKRRLTYDLARAEIEALMATQLTKKKSR